MMSPEYYREYYLRNKEAIISRVSEWRLRNPDRVKAINARAYKKHAWKRRDRYEKNKDAVIKRVMEWQKRNPDLVRYYKRKAQKKVRASKPYRPALYSAKARALRSGLAFELTEQWAASRWTGKCELTGADFNVLPKGTTSAFSVSIDRIDSAKGYTQDNCRFILWSVNRFKSDYDDAIMMHIARLLVGMK